MKTSLAILVACLLSLTTWIQNAAGAAEVRSSEPKRTILPITRPEGKTYTEIDARDATRPDPWSLSAPENAPNIVMVMLDDLGFGQSSAFGGPIRTPTAEKLAEQGIRYNRFHTTALCSPTRAALLSGRNHHSNSMGVIPELSTSFPSYTGIIPKSSASRTAPTLVRQATPASIRKRGKWTLKMPRYPAGGLG